MRKGGLYDMGSNYGKGMYNQLMDVMAKLNALESEHKNDQKAIRALNSETASLRRENAILRDKITRI